MADDGPRLRSAIAIANDKYRSIEHELRALAQQLDDVREEILGRGFDAWSGRVELRSSAIRRLAARTHDARRELASVAGVDDESEDTQPRVPILR